MTLQTDLLTKIRSDVKTDLEALFLYGSIGTDNTTPTANDTELGDEVFRKEIDSFDSTEVDAVTVSIVVGTTEANDSTIREFGWFNNTFSQVDACDAITGWVDSADMTVHLNNTTFWQGTGSIDLTKDAGAAALATTTKTTTSVDFTSKQLSLILYIVDATMLAKLAATNSLIIRFGSDSSNYYQWALDLTDLAVGKNVVNSLTSANSDSTTGTPALTLMDYTYIGITAVSAATTWSDEDLIMDDIKVFAGTMYSRETLTAIGKTDDTQLYLDQTITILVTEV